MLQIARIREIELGMTQAEFSKKLGVDQATVSRWERGITEPSAGAILKIRNLVQQETGRWSDVLLPLSANQRTKSRGRPRLARAAALPRRSAMQKTIRRLIQCRGIGIHSGEQATLTLNPAPVGTGILFRRTDIGVEIPASWARMIESPLKSALSSADGVEIWKADHLMATLLALEIDNLIIEVDRKEVPILDGSAAPFVSMIEEVGISEQRAPRRSIKVLKPIVVYEGESSAALFPDMEFSVNFTIDFANPLIRRQDLSLVVNRETFKREICSARTFLLVAHGQYPHHPPSGLPPVYGIDGENAVLISTRGQILNKGGLRFEDEFVRVKALQAIGDLYLAGAPIIGRFQGYRSGHRLNRYLLQALFDDGENYKWEHSLPVSGQQSQIDTAQYVKELSHLAEG